MVGLKKALAILALTGLCWAQASLPCKHELALQPLGQAPPTDVSVDGAGRVYVLHEGDGFLSIYNKDGVLLEHRGGQAEIRQQPTGVTPLSQWVGRLGKSALLVSEAGQTVTAGAVVPGPHSLEWVPFQGQPEKISGSQALARDLQGNFYVWSQADSKCYRFSPSGAYLGLEKLPPMKRPVQLAVDSQGGLYCVDTWGLHVIHQGRLKYQVEGAQALYLTGSDWLALAGRDWLRCYTPQGRMESEVRDSQIFNAGEPLALSLNDQGEFFLYLYRYDRNDGTLFKLSPAGKVLSEFPQPRRSAASPDPGLRLDYQGRIHWWTGGRLEKVHPGGKVERSMSYVPSAESKGQLVQPSDLAQGPDGQLWIADSGNCRLQRFRFGSGWQQPIPIGIRGGDARGIPRSLAFSPHGMLFMVVHPRDGQGQVVLQTRDLKGKLLGQRDLCPAWGEPVVKMAVAPSGDLFLYQSRAKNTQGWTEAPTLLRFAPKGQLIATAGGAGPGLAPVGSPTRRITLKPQEDLLIWKDRLLLPSGGSVHLFSFDLKPLAEYELRYKQGRNPVFGEFGGASLGGGLLYLVDIGGRCIQRVVLP